MAQLAGSVAEMSAYHHGEVRWFERVYTLGLYIVNLIFILFNFSDLSDDDHYWFGPELCGKQQLEPFAAAGSVWNQVTWWQGLCQPSIHLHHAQVSYR